MKIKLLEPPESEKYFYYGFLNSDKKRVRFLEDSDSFFKRILHIRRKYNIPIDRGFDLDESVSEYFKRTKNDHFSWIEYVSEHYGDELFIKIIGEIEEIMAIYELSERWKESLSFYLFFNLFPSPYKSPISIGPGSDLVKRMKNYDQEKLNPFWYTRDAVIIQVNEYISRRKFLKFIDNQVWENTIRTLFKKPPFSGKTKLRNLGIKKRIFELRNRDKIKYSKIADIISEEYKIVYGEDDVKNIYHRYKKSIDKFG